MDTRLTRELHEQRARIADGADRARRLANGSPRFRPVVRDGRLYVVDDRRSAAILALVNEDARSEVIRFFHVVDSRLLLAVAVLLEHAGYDRSLPPHLSRYLAELADRFPDPDAIDETLRLPTPGVP